MLSREAWGGMPRASVTLEGPDQLGPEEAPGGEGAGGLVPAAGAGLLCTATGSKGENRLSWMWGGGGMAGRSRMTPPTRGHQLSQLPVYWSPLSMQVTFPEGHTGLCSHPTPTHFPNTPH